MGNFWSKATQDCELSEFVVNENIEYKIKKSSQVRHSTPFNGKTCHEMLPPQNIKAFLSSFDDVAPRNIPELIKNFNLSDYDDIDLSDPRNKVLIESIRKTVNDMHYLKQNGKYLDLKLINDTWITALGLDYMKLKKHIFYAHPPKIISEKNIFDVLNLSDKELTQLRMDFMFTAAESTVYRAEEKIVYDSNKSPKEDAPNDKKEDVATEDASTEDVKNQDVLESDKEEDAPNDKKEDVAREDASTEDVKNQDVLESDKEEVAPNDKKEDVATEDASTEDVKNQDVLESDKEEVAPNDKKEDVATEDASTEGVKNQDVLELDKEEVAPNDKKEDLAKEDASTEDAKNQDVLESDKEEVASNDKKEDVAKEDASTKDEENVSSITKDVKQEAYHYLRPEPIEINSEFEVDQMHGFPEFQDQKRTIAFLLMSRREILLTIEHKEKQQEYDVEMLSYENIEQIFNKMKHIQHIQCSFQKLNDLKCKIIKALRSYMNVFHNYQYLSLLKIPDYIDFCGEDMIDRTNSMRALLENKTTNDKRLHDLSTYIDESIHDYEHFLGMKRNILYVTQKILGKMEPNFNTFCKTKIGVNDLEEELYENAFAAWENENTKPYKKLGTRWMKTDKEATISDEDMNTDLVELFKDALQDNKNEESTPPYYQFNASILPYKTNSRKPGDIIEIGDDNFELLSGKPSIEWFCSRVGVDMDEFTKYIEYKKCTIKLKKRVGMIAGMDKITFSQRDLNVITNTARNLERLFRDKMYMSLYPNFFETSDVQQMWVQYLEFVNCMKMYVTKPNEKDMASCSFSLKEKTDD